MDDKLWYFYGGMWFGGLIVGLLAWHLLWLTARDARRGVRGSGTGTRPLLKADHCKSGTTKYPPHPLDSINIRPIK